MQIGKEAEWMVAIKDSLVVSGELLCMFRYSRGLRDHPWDQ